VNECGSGRSVVNRFVVCLGFFLPAIGGCGGNSAVVTGKVVVGHGEAVKGGTLVFSPTGGGDAAPVATEIQPDGTFKLPRGAQAGRYTILFTPPEQQLSEEQRTNHKYIAPPPAYMNRVPKPGEVELKPGTNTVDLELVPRH